MRGILFVWAAILAWRVFLPASSQHLWVDFLFLFLLFGYVVLTAAGIGRMLAGRFKLALTDLEFNIASLLLGLGLLSMSIAVLGLAGLLTKSGIFACLVICGVISSSEWYELFQNAVSSIRSMRAIQTYSVYEKLMLVCAVGMFPLLVINALTPAWDYDALLYHLQVPNQYLAEGRIYFDPEVLRSAYPFLGEMLFAVGISFNLDSLAKLINLTFAVLFLVSVYAWAIRFFTRDVALTSVGILCSAPAFPLWSTWASIDYAWAVYEFWAVFAIVRWRDDEPANATRWLTLAGVMSGLAASTKYISIPALLIVALLVLWKSLQGEKRAWAQATRNLFTFGMSAALVMGIWYIKNWIWTGNPVYPLVFGGLGWDPIKDQVLKGYMQTFGVGTNWWDYLLLPYNVYAYQDQFSTSMQEIVHPLLWLAFIFPFLSDRKHHSTLIAYSGLYYVWWLFGSQVIRFLLPLSAFFAILAGSVIERAPSLVRNLLKLVLIIGLFIVSLVYQFLVLRNSGTFSYVAAKTSPETFLTLFVDDFGVKQYIQDSLDPSARVFFLWDGRGYYCDSRCIPDDEQSHVVKLALGSPSPTRLAQSLRSEGITHLMLHRTDANWFIQYHDPLGNHRQALQYFEKQFLPACATSVYKDSGTELYEITCR
jgi:4-amino-4-deoxy-L-arabinose transferase-like glycosyltransferase